MKVAVLPGDGIGREIIAGSAMMLRYSLNRDALADRVEAAVRSVLAQGLRTGDTHQAGMKRVGTSEMGDAVVAAL